MELNVAGDGLETLSFLHVRDCVKAMTYADAHPLTATSVYNLANRDTVPMATVADIAIEAMGLDHRKVNCRFTGPKAGTGNADEVPVDASKIASLGWSPSYSSVQAVRLAAKELAVGRV